MFGFLQVLNELVGKKVRLTFTYLRPEDGPAKSIFWEGTITCLDVGKKALTFEHLPVDAERMGVKRSHLNLDAIVVWATDELKDNYTEAVNVTCPKCKTKFELSASSESEI